MRGTYAGLASLEGQSPTQPGGRRRATALAVVIGVALGAAVVVLPAIDTRQPAGVDVGIEAAEWPVHELDREWRWAPKGVEFEFMFRTVEANAPLSWLAQNRS